METLAGASQRGAVAGGVRPEAARRVRRRPGYTAISTTGLPGLSSGWPRRTPSTETYVKVAGRWTYLYRAIDQHGQVIDVQLSQRRDLAAARR